MNFRTAVHSAVLFAYFSAKPLIMYRGEKYEKDNYDTLRRATADRLLYSANRTGFLRAACYRIYLGQQTALHHRDHTCCAGESIQTYKLHGTSRGMAAVHAFRRYNAGKNSRRIPQQYSEQAR